MLEPSHGLLCSKERLLWAQALLAWLAAVHSRSQGSQAPLGALLWFGLCRTGAAGEKQKWVVALQERHVFLRKEGRKAGLQFVEADKKREAGLPPQEHQFYP